MRSAFETLKTQLKANRHTFVAVNLCVSFCFTLLDRVAATEVVGSSACGPVPYARLASGIVHSAREELATKFSKNARSHIQSQLRRNFERAQETSKSTIKRVYGDIEQISSRDLPSDPRMAQLVQRANELLQREDVILDFAESTAKLAALSRMEKTGTELDPSLLIRLSPTRDTAVVQKMADQAGWGRLEIEYEVEHPEYFRTRVLARGKLWIDEGGVSLGHPGAAHALQLLLIQPHLESEFGGGATRELLAFLSSRDGFQLWESIFDRGRGYIQDLRGPQAWGAARLLGGSSWLGLE